ncbi:protein tilB homolog [Cephus cinctus]|uniref:Protein tilB homolog n=1 Tax=Cephus cinctus TaxID=211228 RepID=A0AAJ7FDP4_CEPCN|nr:protein tilB homolog [Cephus cinctus]
MVRITVELIRKRSEHNEGEIGTLEEISLHQENIEKIELVDKACRNLKILLLQYNLISKIENLKMLKRLEYLNLALNNIEVIENLEGLESLKKLDLTINFIGDLQGVKKLRYNENLEQLILTGNPCTDYEGYRDYVVASLPQLRELDMTPIDRSERIKGLQRYAEVEGDVIRGYRRYAKIREKQIHRHEEREKLRITEINEDGLEKEDEEVENENFWKSTSYHTPEDRLAIAERTLKIEEKRKKAQIQKTDEPKRILKLFSPDGRAYNVNQAKVSFTLNDEDCRDNVILEVAIYKHLDTSYLEVDVQPRYVRVTIKGKVLQLTLPCEVLTQKSSVKRNVVTGHLVITMPRLNQLETIRKSSRIEKKVFPKVTVNATGPISKRELLEIGPPRDEMDFSKIVRKDGQKPSKQKSQEMTTPRNFVDNPEVPPLE